MTKDSDLTVDLQARVSEARRSRTPLHITGGGSKAFYGRHPEGQALRVSGHRGVVDYAPAELVVTARAGTPLSVLESLLGEQRQMLAFEPPHFSAAATLGGCIATGLSGPRRPYTGAVRDFVLGVKCLNGKGEVLSFGGQVMKNVAGYDVSRLMTGALGTLGVLLEVSLKVLPRPALETTVCFTVSTAQALDMMHRWAGRPLPLSAACYDDGRLFVRLSGSEPGVADAAARVGGDAFPQGEQLWHDLREQRLAFFHGSQPLWRMSVPPAAPPLGLPGAELIDWGGAQRWLRGDLSLARVRDRAASLGGHAVLFRHGDRRGEVFHPLAPGLMVLHRRLKHAFDPDNILNPGRMYIDA